MWGVYFYSTYKWQLQLIAKRIEFLQAFVKSRGNLIWSFTEIIRKKHEPNNVFLKQI